MLAGQWLGAEQEKRKKKYYFGDLYSDYFSILNFSFFCMYFIDHLQELLFISHCCSVEKVWTNGAGLLCRKYGRTGPWRQKKRLIVLFWRVDKKRNKQSPEGQTKLAHPVLFADLFLLRQAVTSLSGGTTCREGACGVFPKRWWVERGGRGHSGLSFGTKTRRTKMKKVSVDTTEARGRGIHRVLRARSHAGLFVFSSAGQGRSV